MLAADDIVVVLDGGSLILRPSLRAAIRLERRYGFPNLLAAITDGDLTVLTAIIRETCDRDAAADMFADVGSRGLAVTLNEITVPCTAVVLALVGEPDGEPGDSSGPLVTFADHFLSLFRMATGWLGWSPDQAWNATPAEIMAAAQGRRDLISDILSAVFGAPDQPSSAPSRDTRNDVLDRAGLASLRGLGSL